MPSIEALLGSQRMLVWNTEITKHRGLGPFASLQSCGLSPSVRNFCCHAFKLSGITFEGVSRIVFIPCFDQYILQDGEGVWVCAFEPIPFWGCPRNPKETNNAGGPGSRPELILLTDGSSGGSRSTNNDSGSSHMLLLLTEQAWSSSNKDKRRCPCLNPQKTCKMTTLNLLF